ncbi:hypothetical protein [Shewanella youngdeokensis]|uniref:Cation transporter n=1 Tax=Shewanella youngdeokensis TaxID=2999068 RepID=A0ABZ0JYL5_9GAMM|nr:hypothetical protein RGE70_00760 [Shewanella sp. DAU334]
MDFDQVMQKKGKVLVEPNKVVKSATSLTLYYGDKFIVETKHDDRSLFIENSMMKKLVDFHHAEEEQYIEIEKCLKSEFKINFNSMAPKPIIDTHR